MTLHRIAGVDVSAVRRTKLLPVAIGCGMWFGALACSPAAQPAAPESLEREFTAEIRPLLKQYCLGCHSAEKHEGELDLERFASSGDVLKRPKAWQQVIEQISLKEMPPKDKPQPAAAQREQLLKWAAAALDRAALSNAGDPGPVVLRRLNNAEFNYTVRDLTGTRSLEPAKEFPADGAAGEGFMNTGNSLVMSPSLLAKYLDAGKDIAAHAVLSPTGIRFSPSTTRRDWTEETLGEIRELYRQYTDARGAEKVNLQGIVFDTNEGGRLPLERYLEATIEMRQQTANAKQWSFQQMAGERHLSPKYLESLWIVLRDSAPSLVLDPLRARWRNSKTGDGPALAADFAMWQKTLWKFSSVGHIGKLGGPKAWMEPVNPFAAQQEIRLKLAPPASGNEVVVYLVASDAGDGNENDFIVWQRPRLVAPGRPDLLLRDVRTFTSELAVRRERVFASAANCLAAAAEAGAKLGAAAAGEPPPRIDALDLARRHGVDADVLAAWLNYLGIGESASAKLTLFANRLAKNPTYDFINGWGLGDTPSLVANSSTQHVRIPGNMKPHGVAVHPSPGLNAAVGWKSPVSGKISAAGTVTHAHPECGNGVEWRLELRRGGARQRLANGIAQGGKEVKFGPLDDLALQPGDLISLLIGPRDGNHSCDLTDIELVLKQPDGGKEWRLAGDVSPDVLAGNPHADSYGNKDVWHFYTEPTSGNDAGIVIPAGSVLAKWQSAESAAEKAKLANDLQELLVQGASASQDGPNAALYRQLVSLRGPLLGAANVQHREKPTDAATSPETSRWGLKSDAFGKHPNGSPIDSASLCVQAPAIIEFRLPADLAEGTEFVTASLLHQPTGAEGSVQVQATTSKPASSGALAPGAAKVPSGKAAWTDPNKPVVFSSPILTNEGSAARQRIEASFDEFRRWFPAALCYVKIVPVDEVVTLTLLHREDEPLRRLMLREEEALRLDRLWDELHFVSQDALTLVDAFEQLWQYATQDADPKVFEPMRKPINDRAAAFRDRLVESRPKHVAAALAFASRAYRRPLSESEAREFLLLYAKLLEQEMPHDDAVRLLIARTFVSPAFLYRLENAPPGAKSAPVNDWELASRLSYFLWSSAPDEELLQVAAQGKLHDPDVLVAQARRMLGDSRVLRLANEFGCAWLHIYDFEELSDKSERHFPGFADLRGPMHEEAVRFLADAFQHDASVLSLFDADHAFLNQALAKHYGLTDVKFDGPDDWRRVEGVKKAGRGGVLGLGAILAQQSGASRTSPILRGNWVAEVLLGDKLPRPPKDVPPLPEDEATESLTVRELTQRHSSDPRCATCHQRIDGYGYALEDFDAVGRLRTRDLGDRSVDSRATLFDGATVDGAIGLRDHLLAAKRDAVLLQFCRKLLGYSLGRGVLLSDKPLLAEMQKQLAQNDYRLSAAVETIVRSPQFRDIRGRDAAFDE